MHFAQAEEVQPHQSDFLPFLLQDIDVILESKAGPNDLPEDERLDSLAIAAILFYCIYACYAYLKIRPHWNETVAYSSWCWDEKQRAACKAMVSEVASGDGPGDGVLKTARR